MTHLIIFSYENCINCRKICFLRAYPAILTQQTEIKPYARHFVPAHLVAFLVFILIQKEYILDNMEHLTITISQPVNYPLILIGGVLLLLFLIISIYASDKESFELDKACLLIEQAELKLLLVTLKSQTSPTQAILDLIEDTKLELARVETELKVEFEFKLWGFKFK